MIESMSTRPEAVGFCVSLVGMNLAEQEFGIGGDFEGAANGKLWIELSSNGDPNSRWPKLESAADAGGSVG